MSRPDGAAGEPASPMPIVGYTSSLSVLPGESISFMVSCDGPTYEAQLVRLLSNGASPRVARLEAPLNGQHAGKKEVYRKGSYVLIPSIPAQNPLASFTIVAWVYPTLIGKSPQSLVTRLDDRGGPSCGLSLDGMGRLTLTVVGNEGKPTAAKAAIPLWRKSWCFVAGAYDTETGEAALYQKPVREWPGADASHVKRERLARGGRFGAPVNPIVLGGSKVERADFVTDNHFNGKIDAPCIISRVLREGEVESIALGVPPSSLGEDLAAAWDFSADITSSRVRDVSGHALHGHTVNNPKRAVTGHNWNGREMDFRQAPEQYGAMYFHEDDLEDAGMEVRAGGIPSQHYRGDWRDMEEQR